MTRSSSLSGFPRRACPDCDELKEPSLVGRETRSAAARVTLRALWRSDGVVSSSSLAGCSDELERTWLGSVAGSALGSALDESCGILAGSGAAIGPSIAGAAPQPSCALYRSVDGCERVDHILSVNQRIERSQCLAGAHSQTSEHPYASPPPTHLQPQKAHWPPG